MTGLILHHETGGTSGATPLLLVGSLGTTLSMWDPQVAVLGADQAIVRVDIRGHGRSPAPRGAYSIAELGMDVAATLDALGVHRVCVCGLSIGGMIAMWLAANAPERVERLILICTSAHMPAAADAYRARAATVRSQRSTETIADGVIDRWFTPGWAREHPDTVAAYRRMLVTIPPDGYAGCCEALAALDLRSAVPRITAPTLVIAGAEDLATPPAHAQAIADAISGARLEVVDAAAHLANVQRPDVVTPLIEVHLQRH